MVIRRKPFTDESPVAFLVARERLALGRYRKERARDPEKRRLLLELALARIREIEQTDYLAVGFRRRRLKL